ncbi:MAG: GNAT family N-acetyltransferase [Lachnospiraceae bacterium]|nr:GNAT family N-acetyltransferase [Lachnospiraceae bacterium]
MYIETQRLLIRDFTVEDATDLHEIFGDDETMKNCEPAYDFEKTKKFLTEFCIGRKGAVAAVQRETGKVIGYILFKEMEDDVYEIGWIFNRMYWGQGYAYESCAKLIDHAFRELNAHKIFAEAIDAVKSIGLMKKLGMVLEGVQRRQTRDNEGNWVDLYFYGLLREDWNVK